ncbi:MAG TPA: hypothetical protein VJ787_06385 [Thermoleophilia bacterium]|nr:hypothetical protein [Thermoleophilia bacterium]
MTILALIVAAIVIQVVLAALVIKTLWIQGDAAANRANDPQPSRAQDFGAVTPPPAPSGATFAPRRGRAVRMPRTAGARYIDGRV